MPRGGENISSAATASKDDKIHVRVLREGKTYTKKVKIEKPPPPAPSAFTTQYNAITSKSVIKEPKPAKRAHGNIYTEKLPPLLDKSNPLKTYKSASQGANTYK